MTKRPRRKKGTVVNEVISGQWSVVSENYSPLPLHSPLRSGFTLVEILVATTLALMLLAAVVTIFGNVAQSITESRSMLEMAKQLRLTATRLQQDLPA